MSSIDPHRAVAAYYNIERTGGGCDWKGARKMRGADLKFKGGVVASFSDKVDHHVCETKAEQHRNALMEAARLEIEAANKMAEEDAARKKADKEQAVNKKADEEAANKKAEEEAAKKKAMEDAKKMATEAAVNQAEKDAAATGQVKRSAKFCSECGAGASLASAAFCQDCGSKFPPRKMAEADGNARSGVDAPQPSAKRQHTPEDFAIDKPIVELGSGGFGVVYRGWDKVTKRAVAVKCTCNTRESLVALQKEYATLLALDHPNIVRAYCFHLDDASIPVTGKIYMELMTQGSVSGIIKAANGTPLSEGVIKRYLRDALLALEYLHSQTPTVLHRDLKPANMLVNEEGVLKLSDFGTSKKTDHSATRTGQVIGSIPFMAPEVVTESKHSVGSDLWALACAVINMATASLPWSELPAPGYPACLLSQNIQQHHPVIPMDERLSPPLVALLKKLVSLQPKDRGTAAEALADPYFTAQGVATAGGQHREEETATTFEGPAYAQMDLDTPSTMTAATDDVDPGVASTGHTLLDLTTEE